MNFRAVRQILILPAAAALLAAAAAPARGRDPERPGSPSAGEDTPGTLLSRVGFDQHLDAQLPLDLTFRDEQGRTVKLGDYFGERPVILTLVYYGCPLLCGQELNGLARSLKPLSLEPGKDYELVTVSINPREKPGLAKAKKRNVIDFFGRPSAANSWHFLTGDQPEIERLARTVGFRYDYNEKSGLYTHAAGLVVATPGGRLSRYFYGIDFPPKDLQFGLIDASAGKIGSPIARLLLFCYHYDAATGKYTLAIVNIIRVAGTATALALGAFLVLMLRREARRNKAAAPAHPAETLDARTQ